MTVDSLGFGEALAAMPEQLAAAHEVAGKVPAAALPDAADFDHVVTLGMGGSGIAGNVLQAVGTATLPVPVTVLKHYRTPAFVGPTARSRSRSSYSGDTEETSRWPAARSPPARALVAISSGGELARLAAGVGLAPRALPRRHPDAPTRDSARWSRRCSSCCSAWACCPRRTPGCCARSSSSRTAATSADPSADGARNPARELARRIGRTIPIIYGSGGLGGVAAMRWKQSVNENAKAPAFWNEYPELDHNEVCGWGQHGDVTRQVFTLVELRHGLEHPRLEQRAAATRELIEEALSQVLTVEAEGEGRLAQLLDLVYLGDWTSYYLALDNDVDPGPIDAIAQLKASIG